MPGGIRFGREVCGDLAQGERREWWLANGTGAYAAGTISGTLTRRYHGLLIAPVHPPLGRMLVCAKADATLSDGAGYWPLHANRWRGGAVDPAGFLSLESFHLDGRLPVWRYALGPVAVEARVWMAPGADTTYVAWRLAPPARRDAAPLRLEARVLMNARDHHGVMPPQGFAPQWVVEDETRMGVVHPDGFTLHVRAFGGALRRADYWVEHFDLPVERARGLSDDDSNLCVAHAALVLTPGEWVGIAIGLAPNDASDIGSALQQARARQSAWLEHAKHANSVLAGAPAWIDQLVLAAADFLFTRPVSGAPDGEGVIAGYPWFGEWGRDAMIALPGLTLATGHTGSARQLLLSVAAFVDQGMVPNRFPGDGIAPEYNTVDAALWYVEACRAYAACTGDLDTVRRLFPVLESILEHYRAGTRYGIRMDPADALLWAGEPGMQLTWMDAKVGDWVVTPRHGKPVEVNALWYNAHQSVADLAQAIGRAPDPWLGLVARIRAGFQRFRRTPGAGLYDVLDGPGGHDAALRPNQIFAVSLHHSPLDEETARDVVDLCGRHLLCSYGLRSLAPGEPGYRERYEGGVVQRDGAYHQGTVWAWLLGHYAVAEFRVTGDAAAALTRLEPVRDHLLDAGLGTISEIFDGAPPHAARGCPAQAWSVACVLDAWWRLEQSRRAGVGPETGEETA
ncbi:MAG: glycogen debranching protein [Chromatiales bacterium 21-64-14]|nr:MAG: glycogen debranching protein [Chromatiales bacterium 21-64-14]